MRLLPALLLASLSVALLPVPAGAQETETPTVLLEDDRGDLEADAAGNPAGVPAGSWDAMDLVSLSVLESPSEFLFALELVSLDATAQQSILASIQYELVFRHADQVYKLRSWVYSDTQVYGFLERIPAGVDPDGAYGDPVADVPVVLDLASDTLSFSVLRDHLTDGKGAVPFPGRVLDLFSVDAGFLNDGGATINGQPVPMPYVEDRMPDAGSSEEPLPVLFGIEQVGDLRLSSNEPFRASNGEEATFVFRINATNLASEEQLAEFVAVGAPMGWDIRLPGLVRLDPNETAEFPVIVRTAFAHMHGSASAFTVELVSQSDDSVGRIQVGLRYPKIAQPSGHHSTVYLHNVDESDDPVRLGIGLVNKGLAGYDYLSYPYLNTALPEDDPADDGTKTAGQTCESLRIEDDNDTVGTTYCWGIPLSPTLEMGLDFDLASLGSYAIPIHSLAIQPGARVQGRIAYYEPMETQDPFYYFYEEPTVLATLLPSDRTDLDVDERHVFEGVIRPEEAGDLVVYRRGASVQLQLEVRTSRPDNFFLGPRTEPELVPGGWMQLPLLDYEDPVDEVFGIASHLHLMLDGDSHRLANPGDTLVYQVSLHNADDVQHEFEATLLGSNHAWGQLVGPERFSVDADGSRSLTVAVTVPADAFDDDRADLVLEVASRDDETIRALVRLVTTSDVDEEHEDQSALLADAEREAKDAPALGAAGLVALVALLALALRRR